MSDLKYNRSLPDVDIWFENLRMYGSAHSSSHDGWNSWPGIPYSRTDKIHLDDIFRLIDNSIALSPSEMCLTSKYEYIRGCKKWLIENDQDSVKMKDPYEQDDENEVEEDPDENE